LRNSIIDFQVCFACGSENWEIANVFLFPLEFESFATMMAVKCPCHKKHPNQSPDYKESESKECQNKVNHSEKGIHFEVIKIQENANEQLRKSFESYLNEIVPNEDLFESRKEQRFFNFFVVFLLNSFNYQRRN